PSAQRKIGHALLNLCVPAKIASFSRTLNVPWKQDIVLRCDAAGVPQPTIVWKFNGKDYVDSTFTNSVSPPVYLHYQ
ncbi:unnamed protein product, partial [Allacma fusca]